MRRWTLSLWVFVLTLLALETVVQCYETHYCPRYEIKPVWTEVKKCYRGYPPRCCWRYEWEWVDTRVYNRRACCDGWGSCYCHVPICSPSCGKNNFCIDPNTCYCRNGAASPTCNPNYCSYDKDCYPGLCDRANCQCASGNEGNNCEKILDGPTFESCSVQLLNRDDPSDVLMEAECGDLDYDNYTYYSKERDYDLRLKWGTTYIIPDDTPEGPAYLAKYAPGIVESHANVSLINQDGSFELYLHNIDGSSDAAGDNPRLIDNNDVFQAINKAMKHKDYLDVHLYATTGGYKQIHHRGDSSILTKQFSGEELFRTVRINFDLRNPGHCKSNNSCDPDDWGFPLHVEPDITKGSVIILWSSWHDDDSGIGEFYYEVYKLGKDQNGELSEKQPPLLSQIWDQPFDAPAPEFTPDETGMYSVVLRVQDQAGNTARARSLFLYDPVGHLETEASKPIRVENAQADAGYSWISSLQNGTAGEDLQITWKEHFVNKFYIDNDLLGKVAAFDGEFDDVDGNRTIDAIDTNNGVKNFQCGYQVASSLRDMKETPTDWQDMDVKDSLGLPVTRTNGDHVRIFVKATDVVQHSIVDYIDIGVDSTSPSVNKGDTKFSENVPTLFPLPEFASTVDINVVDMESGLDEIKYELYEVSARQEENLIQEDVVAVTEEDKSSGCEISGSCFCASSGKCFSRVQSVHLNNCWFMNRDIRSYRFKYEIVNAAKLATTGSYDIPDVSNLVGEGEYPGIQEDLLKVSEGKLTEYSVTLEWRLPQACYETKATILRYQVSGKPREETVVGTSQELEGLCSDTEYVVEARVQYVDGAVSDPISITFNTLEGDSRCKQGVGGSGLSAGAIAGIVIGILLLLIIVVILALLLWRKHQHKPPVPDRISRFLPANWRMSTATSVPPEYPPSYPEAIEGIDAMSFDNHAYKTAAGGGDVVDTNSLYVDESLLTSNWQFPNDRVRIGGFLDNNHAKDMGRFADIRIATLATKTGSRQVIAKMLTAKSKPADRDLMYEKMQFFGNKLAVTKHHNILNFIGALPKHDSGPVLLFEHCNRGKLSDWLKALQKKRPISEDDEYNMSSFCINVACGMDYLHENGIIHKRLGARNILLMETNGVLVAKIAGFGPMKDEKLSKGRIPARYFAPEQMIDSETAERPYTMETDVWTFGVTVYEIYSKGAKPFEQFDVPDLKMTIMNGYQMEKPRDCSNFVYDDVMLTCWDVDPQSRPGMHYLHAILREHFEGANRVQSGYYDENMLKAEQDEIYWDAVSSLQPGQKAMH